jgi:LysR family glycine cleavage system transcriptional activator
MAHAAPHEVHAREPEIEVRIDASPVLADLARDPFDLAIREGPRGYPEAESVRLFALEYLRRRECGRREGPAPAQRHHRLVARAPAARGHVRLLAGLDRDGGQPPTSTSRAGLFFSHTMLALDAAIEGQGVALAPIRSPSASSRAARSSCSIRAASCRAPASTSPGRGARLRTLSPAATSFRDWLIDEARAGGPRDAASPRVRRQGSPSVTRRRTSSRK